MNINNFNPANPPASSHSNPGSPSRKKSSTETEVKAASVERGIKRGLSDNGSRKTIKALAPKGPVSPKLENSYLGQVPRDVLGIVNDYVWRTRFEGLKNTIESIMSGESGKSVFYTGSRLNVYSSILEIIDFNAAFILLKESEDLKESLFKDEVEELMNRSGLYPRINAKLSLICPMPISSTFLSSDEVVAILVFKNAIKILRNLVYNNKIESLYSLEIIQSKLKSTDSRQKLYDALNKFFIDPEENRLLNEFLADDTSLQTLIDSYKSLNLIEYMSFLKVYRKLYVY